MCLILILIMVLLVYAHVQTHQVAHIKYVQSFEYQLYLNRAVTK